MNGETVARFLHSIRDVVPLLIFLVITPLAFYLSYQSRRKQAGKLKDLAAKLGLQFQGEQNPGALDQAYRQRMESYRGSDRAKAEQVYRKLEQSGFLKSLLSMAKPLSIGGKYNGYQVEVKLLRQNKRNLTEAVAWFAEPLGIGLNISKSGFWNRSITLGRSSRVETGNAELDRAASIRARDELGARYIARNVQAQQALLALLKHKGAEINDQVAIVRQDGYQTDYSKTKQILDDMTRAMQAVSASLGKT